MMVETNQIISWSAIIVALLAMGIQAPDLMHETENPQYFCDARPSIGLVECDSFSKYVSEVGKCVRNEDTNLICREGWLLVTPNTVLPEEKIIPDEPIIPVISTDRKSPGTEICTVKPRECTKI